MKNSIFPGSKIPITGILFILLLAGNIMAQDKQLAWNLYHSYENYKEKSLINRRFKHSYIIPLIEQLKNKKNFRVNKAGNSVEGRDIYLITLGNGKTKVFLWSQMHGDEPTATAALFDMFNFFADEKEFTDFKKFLFSNLTLYFIPMVNPDGAEYFQRRNIFEIDLNRDVLRQQTPEAQILKNVFDSLKADFGFNLHDQGRDYAAGNSFKPASISFLAPSPDFDKSITPARENAMKLIGNMVNILNDFIPGHIGKYMDDYEPRAFGDNFTKWGTGVVLVESGGWRGDREKQYLRKINYLAILSALNCIASRSYEKQNMDIYQSIPNNEKLMMDVILRNLNVNKSGNEYVVDIGINFEENNLNSAKDFYLEASIEDIGDLSVFSGYEEFDLSGYTVEPGKTKPNVINSAEELNKIHPVSFFNEGFTSVQLNDNNYNDDYSKFPFNIILNNSASQTGKIEVDGNADFIIRKNGEVKFAVVNGFLIDVANIGSWNGNSLIIK